MGLGGSISTPSYRGFSGATPAVSGAQGYTVVQPDGADTAFQVVQPTALPTNKTSSSSSNQNTSGSRTGTNTSSGSRTANSSTRDTGSKTTNSTARKTGNNVTTTTGSSTTDFMDPKTREAYNQLLSVLSSGGTDSMKTGMAELEALLGRSREDEEEFTTDAARAQAQQSMPKYARQLREEVMPSIYNAQEGAGLSGDAMTALLAQDQVTRVSEAASAAELAAIQAFGQLAQQQQTITGDAAEGMMNDPSVGALNDLLQIGKGSYEQSQTNQVVNEVINEVINTTENESYDNLSNTNSNEVFNQTDTSSENYNESVASNETANEGIQYQTIGGGEGGTGGGGTAAGTNNFGRQATAKDQDEAMALLLANLSPGSTLQDYYRNDPMQGMNVNQQSMAALAQALGVAL